MAGILLHEHRQDEAMRASRARLAVRFPTGLEPSAAVSALDGLSGLPSSVELVAELSATEDGIGHAIWVPATVRSSVESALTGAIPGLRLTEAPQDGDQAVTLARRLSVSTPAILSTDDPAAASRVLLTGLASLRRGERVVVCWALRPSHAPALTERDKPDAHHRDVQRAWRRKTAASGVRASGAILISAKPGRARELASQIESVLRSRRGLAGGIRTAAVSGKRTFGTIPRTTPRSGWLSGAELVALLAFPLGSETVPGVSVGVSRQLPVPRQVPSKGRALFVGHDPGGERTVALSTTAAQHHLCAVGPTGTGKSTLLAGAVLSDIAHGFGGVVFDGKGPDLIDTILDRVPAEQADRVVVLDPADVLRAIPGAALLSNGDPDLAAETLTGALRSVFGDAWTVRADFYGGLGIRTLAQVPGSSLADLPRLFFDEPFRRAAVARLTDPFLVSSWQSYEELSDAARAEHVQAPMHRTMALLARPKVRSVLASRKPTVDIGRLLAERRFLLISISPGQLGEATANLLATALLYAVWSAIEARAALPAEQRRFVAIYIDELASLGRLPFSFEQMAERARGLGAGLTVALQTLSQVSEPTRSALLANCASFVSFRSSTEAAAIARQLPGLTERDVMGLGGFEVAARISTGLGGSVAITTGRTLPLPPATGMAETIRDASAARYGSEPEEPLAAPPDSRTPEPQGKPGRTGRAS
ncbi:MAG: type IV secretory system conjugative DNA transfer family protein [Solirubrobacteraceae bacterium]